jgi:hypothetical protein
MTGEDKRLINTIFDELKTCWRATVDVDKAMKAGSSRIGQQSRKVTSNCDIYFQISPLFVLKVGRVGAIGAEVEGHPGYYPRPKKKFIVLKGSKARRYPTPSLGPSKVALRAKLIQDRKLATSDKGDDLVFVEDVEFNSLSEAASIITGNPRSGPQMWVEKDTGKSYKDWEKEEPRRWGVSLCMNQTIVA